MKEAVLEAPAATIEAPGASEPAVEEQEATETVAEAPGDAATAIVAACVAQTTPSVPNRRSYAGVLRNGRFERTKAYSVSDLTPAEFQQVYADLQHRTTTRDLQVTEKEKIRRRNEEAAQARDLRLRLSEQAADRKLFEACQAERKVKFRKWFEAQTAESRSKRQREQAMLQKVLASEQ